jgi:hypothetical protein
MKTSEIQVGDFVRVKGKLPYLIASLVLALSASITCLDEKHKLTLIKG